MKCGESCTYNNSPTVIDSVTVRNQLQLGNYQTYCSHHTTLKVKVILTTAT